MIESVGTPWLWGGFTLFVLAMLTLDLGVFHRTAHVIGPREALGWSAFWIALALVFNAGVFRWFGPARGLEFLTGYLIEKALSVDNIFVFLVIFSYFAVPRAYRHRVGMKMIGSEVYRIPIGLSLAVVAGLIGGSVVFSLRRPPAAPAAPEPAGATASGAGRASRAVAPAEDGLQ